MKKDIFGIQVIADEINLAILWKKKLVDPLVKECTESINETKLVT